VKNKSWSDPAFLKSISNPTKQAYEIKIKNPEITFEGVKGQPDFASAYITFYPNKKVIELKSLKGYFFQFRDKILSYERLINVIYDDIISVYNPYRLRIVMLFNARGGISSKLCIDSDWTSRGGKEEFKDWVGQEETW
jgi:7-cyano-7-deazaguanine reductase